MLGGDRQYHCDGLRGVRRASARQGEDRALYMCVMVTSRHNPAIAEFYERLVAAGRLKKVALVACMRKLLSILNAMMRDQSPWRCIHALTP